MEKLNYNNELYYNSVTLTHGSSPEGLRTAEK